MNYKYVEIVSSVTHFRDSSQSIELSGNDYTASRAIYMLTDNLNCVNAQLTAPHIFFKAPEALHQQNCTLNGEVVYLSDPNTCVLYKDDIYLEEYCPSKHVDL